MLNIVHGGDWNVRNPYDSLPVFERGFDNQADAVKGDFRTNMVNEGMDSSPVECFDSFNCQRQKGRGNDHRRVRGV